MAGIVANTVEPEMKPLEPLFDASHMLFKDHTERYNYFLGLRTRKFVPPAGAAMKHAAVTNLGLNGNYQQLLTDSAYIMAYELIGFIYRLKQVVVTIHPHQVLQSTSFLVAFQTARGPQEARLHNHIRGMGSNHLTLEPMDEEKAWKAAEALDNYHVPIVQDIIEANKAAEALANTPKNF